MATLRIKHAKIENDGDNYICIFEPDKQCRFVWNWQTDHAITLNGEQIDTQHFKTLDQFEGWCRRYAAEH